MAPNPMTLFLWTSRIIRRAEVKAHRERTYLFGDNALYRGLGGMARECRGELNAVGVPTKWTPRMNDEAFFSDNDNPWDMEQDLIESAIQRAESYGNPIVVPAGLGRGLAQMPTRCPKLYAWMCKRLERP